MLVFVKSVISCGVKMSKMIANYGQFLSLLHFIGGMSVLRRCLFALWLSENVAEKKSLVLSEYVLGQIIKTKLSEAEKIKY